MSKLPVGGDKRTESPGLTSKEIMITLSDCTDKNEYEFRITEGYGKMHKYSMQWKISTLSYTIDS